MGKERVLVLNHHQIDQKITRMAHEIRENHYPEKEIVLVGIKGKGERIAAYIAEILNQLPGMKVTSHNIELNKDQPLSTDVIFSGNLKDLKSKPVVLVDDVINSGRTLIYAAKFLLDAEPRKLSTATLADRFHRTFPIRADYVGITLSTNLKEHVEVEVTKGKWAMYLQ
ncbi:MAG: phosphoribosyltransferase family protein [Flavobacteriales bacterium]|nr:phosphoribosyltransferase family protein [Flavobacteriales bacterium]